MLDNVLNFNKIVAQLIKDAQTIAEVEMINFVMANFERQGFWIVLYSHGKNEKAASILVERYCRKQGL